MTTQIWTAKQLAKYILNSVRQNGLQESWSNSTPAQRGEIIRAFCARLNVKIIC